MTFCTNVSLVNVNCLNRQPEIAPLATKYRLGQFLTQCLMCLATALKSEIWNFPATSCRLRVMSDVGYKCSYRFNGNQWNFYYEAKDTIIIRKDRPSKQRGTLHTALTRQGNFPAQMRTQVLRENVSFLENTSALQTVKLTGVRNFLCLCSAVGVYCSHAQAEPLSKHS